MLQDRLSWLAILSIENEKAKKMDVDELVNIFAEKKCRRKKFWTYCSVECRGMSLNYKMDLLKVMLNMLWQSGLQCARLLV